MGPAEFSPTLTRHISLTGCTCWTYEDRRAPTLDPPPHRLHILDLQGPPSSHHYYIFNGDYVDRGTSSWEVLITLLALFLACPRFVFLNRGNHEDKHVCDLYVGW